MGPGKKMSSAVNEGSEKKNSMVGNKKRLGNTTMEIINLK